MQQSASESSSPMPRTAAFPYCRYGHERRNSHMWEALPLMRALLQDALMVHPSQHSHTVEPEPDGHSANASAAVVTVCAIHLRMDDILTIRDPQYPIIAYRWYHDLLQQARPPCTHINFVSREIKVQKISHDLFLDETLRTTHKLQQSFLSQLQTDFPRARVAAQTQGTLDDDMRMLASSQLLIGSSSTFSLWAAVACVGKSFLPQSLLFYDAEVAILRRTPLLAIRPAPLINSTWVTQELLAGRGDAVVQHIMHTSCNRTTASHICFVLS